MFSFFMFPFGLFIWVVPFILIGLGIKIIRHMYHSSSRRFDSYNNFDELISEKKRSSEEKSVSTTSYSSGEWESKIFRLAYKMKGRITLSDVVLEMNVGLKDAEQIMYQMVDGVHVRMEVKDNGLVVYEFPEIIARFEGDETL